MEEEEAEAEREAEYERQREEAVNDIKQEVHDENIQLVKQKLPGRLIGAYFDLTNDDFDDSDSRSSGPSHYSSPLGSPDPYGPPPGPPPGPQPGPSNSHQHISSPTHDDRPLNDLLMEANEKANERNKLTLLVRNLPFNVTESQVIFSLKMNFI